MAEFINKVEQFSGLSEEDDVLWWQDDKEGASKVNKAYRRMNNNNQQINNCPWKNIWKTKLPYKVACSVWLLAKELVLTQENLMKRGIILSLRFFLCGEQAETVKHLFLHCRITGHLWRLFLSLRGMAWCMPGLITEALTSWEQIRLQANNKGRWRMIPAVIWCSENVENSMQHIKLNCILLLCFWCNQNLSNDPVSIIDVLDSL
ncbi:unnamed protein product [Withania somnifera]